MPTRVYRLSILLILAAPFCTLFCGCSNRNSGVDQAGNATSANRPELAYITNGVAEFWTVAQMGAMHAGRDLDCNVTVVMPNGMTDQTRKIEDLLTRGTDGIAISPIDADNQVDVINRAAAATNLITQDSDAPNANRLMYIGMDNYIAGRMCGELVREALPEGGEVMLLIGRIDQDNAKHRRQGCIDAILGRDADRTRKDPPGEVLKSDDGKYTILGTLTDQFDRAKGKANAEDTLTRYPDVAAMVGLFVYNAPLILEALDRAGKLGQVQVVSFDEAEATLQAIKDGYVHGTVVQDPYRYGYESIRILKQLHEGDQSVIPENKFVDIPAKVIKAENVDEFWQGLKEKLGKD